AELSNTVANVYYRTRLYLSDPESRRMPSSPEAFVRMAEGSLVLSDRKFAPKLVIALREVRSEAPHLFDYVRVYTLDTLKYHIPDADRKSPIRRLIERQFRNPKEFYGLYDLMRPLLSASASVGPNETLPPTLDR